jgi:hypothetical protein
MLNLWITNVILLMFQYYRKARQMALHAVFPEFDLDEDENGSGVGRLSYPRPISEPPSPTSSRATTPIPSDQSDEDDEVDEEREVNFKLYIYRLEFTRKIPFLNGRTINELHNFFLLCFSNLTAQRIKCRCGREAMNSGGLHRTVVVKRLNTPIRIRMILLTNNRGVVELLRVTVTPVNLLDLKCATVCGFSEKAAHSKFKKPLLIIS